MLHVAACDVQSQATDSTQMTVTFEDTSKFGTTVWLGNERRTVHNGIATLADGAKIRFITKEGVQLSFVLKWKKFVVVPESVPENELREALTQAGSFYCAVTRLLMRQECSWAVRLKGKWWYAMKSPSLAACS